MMIGTMQKRLLIEGWRFIPHSYALIAQAHSLCLVKRGDIDLRFRDLPYYYPAWRRTRNVFPPADEQVLQEIRGVDDTYAPEVTLRICAGRLDVSAPATGRKFVFTTPEFRILTQEHLAGLDSAAEVSDAVDFLTCSHWASLAFERFGIRQDRVHVVPLGIDPTVIHPDAAARSRSRQSLGIGGEFVFMSVGAMTMNKGMDLLLPAFARVAETEPDARLVLKGADGLYESKEFLRQQLDDLPAAAREMVVSRLIYNGNTFSARTMGDFLRAADCYVSPYRAEGFNMPVLEAAGSGVPVICTAGGPTDEFTEPSFARRIDSRAMRITLDVAQSGDYLEPDLDHLTELMRTAVRNREESGALGALAAQHVLRHYTWGAVNDALLEHLMPGRAASADHVVGRD
jgi:glycosyltransferase involved in cell wall biosynthesis